MRSQAARKKVSATDARNLRTLLLLNVFEPEEIGDRIRQARERAGLRQEDLADLIEMSTRQVQNYEAGESKQYGKLKAIAGATGVTVEWLLHGDPEAPEPNGHLDAEEIRARFEGLAHIVREETAGITDDLQHLGSIAEKLDLLTATVGGLDVTLREVVDRLDGLEGGQRS